MDTISIHAREVVGGVLVFMGDHVYLVIGGTIVYLYSRKNRGVIL